MVEEEIERKMWRKRDIEEVEEELEELSEAIGVEKDTN